MNNAEKFQEVFGYYATEMWAKPESEFLDWINSEYTPTIDIARPKEKWIDRNGWSHCSNCGGDAMPQNDGCAVEPCHTPFCPWCDADMRGTENE